MEERFFVSGNRYEFFTRQAVCNTFSSSKDSHGAANTVIVDGMPARSCLMFAAQAEACDIRTVESLAQDGQLSKLQALFGEKHALQCGFCTPGILMTLQAAYENKQWPTSEKDARHLLGGNICRCTGYQNIVDAVMAYDGERLRDAEL